MRAAVLYGKEDVRIEQRELTPLLQGEARLRIKAALTCGTDLKVFKRGYHAKMIVPPAVFGHELAGVITEIDCAAEGWNPGDRVVVANSAPCGNCAFCKRDQENLCEDLLFLNGAYAEEINIPARIVQKNMIRLAEGTSFSDAALTEPLACVVLGMQDLQPRSEDRVLIIGSGPISLMFARLCKGAGCSVTLAGRGAERLEKARRLGADAVVDLGGADDWQEVLRSHSGALHDIVIEAVGKPETWEAAVTMVRKGGKVNFFGGCPAGTKVSLDTSLIHYSNLALLASFHHTPGTIRKALGFIESNVIRAQDFVGGTCALSELPELFRGMAKGNRAVKTLIDVSR